MEQLLRQPESLAIEQNPWLEFETPRYYLEVAETLAGKTSKANDVMYGQFAANLVTIGDTVGAVEVINTLQESKNLIDVYLAGLDVVDEEIIGMMTGLEDRLEDPQDQFRLLCELITRGYRDSTNDTKAKALLEYKLEDSETSVRQLVLSHEQNGYYEQAGRVARLYAKTEPSNMLARCYEILSQSQDGHRPIIESRHLRKHCSKALKYSIASNEYRNSFSSESEDYRRRHRDDFNNNLLSLRVLGMAGDEKARNLYEKYVLQSGPYSLLEKEIAYKIIDNPNSVSELKLAYKHVKGDVCGRDSWKAGCFETARAIKSLISHNQPEIVRSILLSLEENYKIALNDFGESYYSWREFSNTILGRETREVDVTNYNPYDDYRAMCELCKYATSLHALGTGLYSHDLRGDEMSQNQQQVDMIGSEIEAGLSAWQAATIESGSVVDDQSWRQLEINGRLEQLVKVKIAEIDGITDPLNRLRLFSEIYVVLNETQISEIDEFWQKILDNIGENFRRYSPAGDNLLAQAVYGSINACIEMEQMGIKNRSNDQQINDYLSSQGIGYELVLSVIKNDNIAKLEYALNR